MSLLKGMLGIAASFDIAPAAISLLKFEANLQKHLADSTVVETEQSLQRTVLELSDLPLLLKLVAEGL